MLHEEPPHARKARFERIRRAKWLLRFLPRRARFHTYPVVGRFAAFARKRDYLWSFRYETLRPSFYMGSIVSLLPLMGVQIPIVFGLCLLLRTNLMVAGGLQFLTNPVTFAPVYYGTFKLGEIVLFHSGWGPVESVPAVPSPDPALTLDQATEIEPTTTTGNWLGELARRFRVNNLSHLFNSMALGGLISGAAVGAALDLLWRFFILPAARLRAAKKPITAQVTPHDPSDTSTPFSS